jgi:hypothetical protein
MLTVGSSNILLGRFFQNYGRRSGSRFRLVFRGWFYSTDFVDIVKQYYVSETPTVALKDAKVRKGRFDTICIFNRGNNSS